MLSKEEIAELQYEAAHKSCGIRVGDWVRVERKAVDHEMGWGIGWDDDMDETVGEIFEVIGDRGNNGFYLSNGYIYPWFVLTKREKPQEQCPFKPFDRVLVRDDDSQEWMLMFFSRYMPSDEYPYETINGQFEQCIFYEGNEELAFTNRPFTPEGDKE